MIVRGGVGLDTIDADYAKSKGITVMNTPMASSASVAELTVGYMFALARSTYQAAASMKSEKWEKKNFEGDEIGGKTLGLIGVGNIGKEVAKRAHALGMTVVAYDPYVKAVEGVKAADQAVRGKPYQAIGIAFAVGAVVAYFVMRRCSRNGD